MLIIVFIFTNVFMQLQYFHVIVLRVCHAYTLVYTPVCYKRSAKCDCVRSIIVYAQYCSHGKSYAQIEFVLMILSYSNVSNDMFI